VVIYDRLTLYDEHDDVAFLLHGGAPPERTGSLMRFPNGGSTVLVRTLLPREPTYTLVDEAKNHAADLAYLNNTPPEIETPEGTKLLPSTRVEVRAPTRTASRTFMHAMFVGAAGTADDIGSFEAPGANGAILGHEAFVFVESTGRYQLDLPSHVRRVTVVGVTSGSTSVVTRIPSACRVELTNMVGSSSAKAQALTIDIPALTP
jgi:hypothetical protein